MVAKMKGRAALSIVLIGVLTAVLSVIGGCTLEHTLQSSQTYSRQLGVSNQYSVERWNNRAIPRNSSILVATTGASPDLDLKALQAAIVTTFTAGFTRVEGYSMVPATLAKAQKAAQSGQFGFLLVLQRITTSKVSSESSETMPEASEQSEVIHYSGLRVEMALIDTLTGHTLDKAVITAKPSYVKFFGDDLKSLLSKPLRELVDDLSGV